MAKTVQGTPIDARNLKAASRQGDSNVVQMFGGGTTNNQEVCIYDALGNVISSGQTISSIGAGGGVRVVTSTTDTVLNADLGKLVSYSNASAISVTLPQAGSGGGFGNKWYVWIENRNTGLLTITPSTSTIDGASSYALNQNQGVGLFSDGSNYYTYRGFPKIRDADLSLTDITTNNATTSAHGFTPKGDGDSSHFLNGNLGWGTPSGTSGLVLLESHTASTSSSLDFTTWYSSSYDDYLIKFVNVLPSNSNTSIRIRVSTNGGSTYDSGSNYEWGRFYWQCTGFATGGDVGPGNPQSSWNIWLTDTLNTASRGGYSGRMELFNPGGSSASKHFLMEIYGTNVSPTAFRINTGGRYIPTTAINAFTVFPDAGTLTSGAIRIYGYKT